MSRRRWPRRALVGAITAGLAGAGWLLWSVARDEPVAARVAVRTLEDGAEALVIDAGHLDLAGLRRAATQAGRPDALVAEDAATWRLTMTVVVRTQSRLDIAAATLRLTSRSDKFVGLEARGGTIRSRRATVTSWDGSTQGPDLEPADGRAYVLVLDDGRLDATASVFSALGYQYTDRHGVTWSRDASGTVRRSRFDGNYVGAIFSGASRPDVSGLTAQRSVNEGLRVENVHDLDLRELVLRENAAEGAVVTGEATDVRLTDVEASDNGLSAIAVKDRSRRVHVERARLHTNGESGLVVSRSHSVSIRGATAWDNETGVLVDVGTTGVRLEGSRVAGNRAAGLLVLAEGSDAVVTTTRFDHNTVAGVLVKGGRVVVGPANRMEHNDAGLRIDDETPEVVAHNNVIADNAGVGVDMVVARGLALTDNQIVGNVAAPFAVRTPADSVSFAHVNTVLPSRRGWEVLRGEEEPDSGAPLRPVPPVSMPSPGVP